MFTFIVIIEVLILSNLIWINLFINISKSIPEISPSVELEKGCFQKKKVSESDRLQQQ